MDISLSLNIFILELVAESLIIKLHLQTNGLNFQNIVLIYLYNIISHYQLILKKILILLGTKSNTVLYKLQSIRFLTKSLKKEAIITSILHTALLFILDSKNLAI